MDRALDVIIACILIVFTLPLMVIVSLAIILDSPGPVLSSGDRPDLHSYGDGLFRFRIRDEPDRTPGIRPLTRVGRFLYFTRLEDLPQLFNILRGDLALFSKRCVTR
jgi:lipopolysaccharide/colanic/teichoic acid biosynthesis glycosyltransferase